MVVGGVMERGREGGGALLQNIGGMGENFWEVETKKIRESDKTQNNDKEEQKKRRAANSGLEPLTYR